MIRPVIHAIQSTATFLVTVAVTAGGMCGKADRDADPAAGKSGYGPGTARESGREGERCF